MFHISSLAAHESRLQNAKSQHTRRLLIESNVLRGIIECRTIYIPTQTRFQSLLNGRQVKMTLVAKHINHLVLAITNDAQHDVLRTDVVIIQANSLFPAVLKNLSYFL